MKVTKSSKRRPIQFHLSTGIVLVVSAGVLMKLNLTPWIEDAKNIILLPGQERPVFTYGFPLPYYTNWSDFLAVSEDLPPNFLKLYWKAFLVVDLLVALILLFAIAFACEQWIGWRESRKRKVRVGVLVQPERDYLSGRVSEGPKRRDQETGAQAPCGVGDRRDHPAAPQGRSSR